MTDNDKASIRVLVCGGRNFNNAEFVYQTLNELRQGSDISIIIEGGALGADRIASDWANKKSISTLRFPAQWARYHRAAGPIRNKQMLEEGKPDLVLAFPGGHGTANMVRLAEEAKVTVLRVSPSKQRRSACP